MNILKSLKKKIHNCLGKKNCFCCWTQKLHNKHSIIICIFPAADIFLTPTHEKQRHDQRKCRQGSALIHISPVLEKALKAPNSSPVSVNWLPFLDSWVVKYRTTSNMLLLWRYSPGLETWIWEPRHWIKKFTLIILRHKPNLHIRLYRVQPCRALPKNIRK